MGDRGEKTCKRLWQRVPPAYRRLLCYTDFWDAHGKVLLDAQHCPGGKGSGQTNHLGRWNNTLRQCLARFVRQTLSFCSSTTTTSPSGSMTTPNRPLPELPAYYLRLIAGVSDGEEAAEGQLRELHEVGFVSRNEA